MPWTAKTQRATNLAVVGTELFSNPVTLNPGELSDIQIIANSSGTTDNLTITVYTTLDDATENWDTVGIISFPLDCTDGNDNDISLILSGIYRYRIGFIRTGSTDTITTNMFTREDGVNL